MRRIITCTLLAANLSLFALVTADAQYTEQELPAPISGNGADRLGFSCDIDGDVMIVGAPYATVSGVERMGTAIIYRRNQDGEWLVESELHVVDPDFDISFIGSSVAISGDTAVVGVPILYPINPPPTDSLTGGAFVFTYSKGAWTQTAKLAADPDSFGGDDFAYQIAIDGDTIAVSAPDAYDDFSTSTPLFIYTRNAAEWSLQDVIYGSEILDGFGTSLALDGDRLVVGDNMGPPGEPDAYVYSRTGSAWSLEAELHLEPEIGGLQRGWDVAISGDTVLVSSWSGLFILCEFADCAPNHRGSVHVFVRDGASWKQQARIDGPPAMPDGYRSGFGQSIAISGNVFLTAATYRDLLYVYTRSVDQWVQQHEISPPEVISGAYFGYSVALSHNAAVVGYFDSFRPVYPSTAYAYHFDPMAAFTLPAMTNQTFLPDITLTFSEPVTGLTADDFSVDGLSVSKIQGSEDEYTMDITLQTGDGTKSLFLPAGSVEDTSGTINAQSPTASILLDQTPPTSQALLADLTQAGSFVEGTYNASDAGSGIDTLTLYALSPSGTWMESTSSLVENGSLTYVPSGGDGLHRIATVATDKVGNVEPAPSGNATGDVALLWNDINNSTFTHPAATDGVYTFPMTTPLDVMLDITGDAGSTTVSRTVGDVAPAGLETTRLIDESITITLGKPGASALVTWNAHPPNIASHTHPLNTVLQYSNGEFLHQYDLSIEGNALQFGPIAEGGTFYAGDRLTIIGDVWMLF